MKKTLEALIAVLELSAENLNLERGHNFAIEHERYYDNFIADLGDARMKARAILESFKYQDDWGAALEKINRLKDSDGLVFNVRDEE